MPTDTTIMLTPAQLGAVLAALYAARTEAVSDGE